jgi:outer membrane PBP1 activator LpoA protein
MKFFMLTVILLLVACDNSTPAPKIAAPQREALEKAKGVDQMVQKSAEETRNKAKEAEGY